MQQAEHTKITYDATGRKWFQTLNSETVRAYTSNGQFSISRPAGTTVTLEGLLTANGRLVLDEGSAGHPEPELYAEYWHRDHLGNVRVIFTDRNHDGVVQLLTDSEVKETVDYYPFGMSAQSTVPVVDLPEDGLAEYRYNGMERNEELGLDLAPFRSYDATIGRWLQVDPIYKFHESGYAAMANNPVLYNDPMGLDTVAPQTLPTVIVPGQDGRISPDRSIMPIPVAPVPVPVSPTVAPTGAPATAPAAGAGARILGIFALLLAPAQLGQGSDMPTYLPVGEPPTDGYAIVHHYNTEPAPGHFSVEVHYGGQVIHTDQMILDYPLATKTTIRQTPFIFADFRRIQIQLPNALAALEYQ